MRDGKLAVILILVLAVAGCQPPAPVPDETVSETVTSAADAVAEVRQVFETYVSNWNAADIESVLAGLDNEVVQMQPDTVLVGKDSVARNWRQHLDENVDTWEPTIDEIEAARDLVFLKTHFTETWTPKAGGETTTITGKGVNVFRRDDSGEWKLVLEQWFDDGSSL